ncbi:DNA cytosine methyltransferase [Roseburia inulinivorans]|jgi:DNA (cytosine-5)-methyltransferase 1|uniref:DNA (cytosine-5-)-methyltransferase n=1 Tax=Roseburia inulinivorans TaxID=360807 RepID=A0A3R5ZDV7_9FIRM|nr:DNA cytosine methyltransferase [Roseburia inulinivorans]RGR67456.1 DNA cytosine methyltransferase [Roseburia inulinivorans]DAZ35639.1 MAG TPA: DNA cytosine methyltransferase [Caudoviricetes sp.]
MINGELIVDNFAGGGGASTGIELATGYSVDIAINHDPEAIKMHKANHPNTKHYCENVWAVDPVKACNGHPVGLAWFSPDCKHFSKAKGGKPKDKNIRGLAWVALRWAGLVRPRVIMLENVEEFKTWGPLNRRHHPIRAKQGKTFERFVQQLRDLGYEVEFRELIAADYGAPTMRKRFFMVARCDGKSIVWPEPTHAPADSEEVKKGLLKPYVGAYTQLDFSLPCPSIFDTSEEIKEKYGIRAVRPLAQKTMDRIARGLKKFVLENPEPFIIQCNHGGERRPNDIREPMPTITGKHGYGIVEPYMVQCKYNNEAQDVQKPIGTLTTVGSHLLVEPYMVQIGQTGFTKDRSKGVREPLTTIVSKNEHCLISPTLIQYHSETAQGEVRGQTIKDPIMTVDGSNRYGLVTSFLSKFYKSGIGQDEREPLHTITTSAGHFGEVRAFLIKYYGDATGQDIEKPLDTVTTKDRFGLVTIEGVDYQIVDIGLRMLEPRELYGCQGFPDDYIIDHDYTGKTYPRSEQVRRCGNAVCPPIPAALVKANLPELCVAERMPNMRIEAEQTGQLRFA